jgi:hypothetical protein
MRMHFLIVWLIQLTDNFALLLARHRQIEERLKKLEREVRGLREQPPDR